jgi:hypothetical protein
MVYYELFSLYYFLHLFSFETPKFSANHIDICFWDYIAWVVNEIKLEDYSSCKINSKEFHLTIVQLYPVNTGEGRNE